MKYLNLETFTDFVCIGSECPYTCCSGWQITVDEETDRFYKSVDGEMGDRLKNCIQREDGKAWFIMRQDGSCPFLNENGLCSIYINLGEEHLSNTCTYYPRYAFCEGDIYFAGISISCPVASRFYLTHEEPLLIDFAENDDNSDVNEDTDWELFNRAIRAFTTSVAIAQNRAFTVRERIALVVLFVYGFQNCVDEGCDPSDLIALYSSPENFGSILERTGITSCDLASKTEFSSGILYLFKDVEGLGTKLPEIAELIGYFGGPENTSVDREVWGNAFSNASSQSNEIWRENVLVYILFRYFMKGMSEKDFYDRLMNGLGPVLIMSNVITALYTVMHSENPSMDYIIMLVMRLSRIIEHNSNVCKEVTEYFRRAGYNDPGFVLRLIS